MAPSKTGKTQSSSAGKSKSVKQKPDRKKQGRQVPAGTQQASKKQAGKKHGSDNIYVAKSEIHGKGLFAARKLPADTVIGLLEGKTVKKQGKYVMWVSPSEGLEITNEFRFINHSDNPNVALYDEEVVTLRAVRADEELTHNYDG